MILEGSPLTAVVSDNSPPGSCLRAPPGRLRALPPGPLSSRYARVSCPRAVSAVPLRWSTPPHTTSGVASGLTPTSGCRCLLCILQNQLRCSSKVGNPAALAHAPLLLVPPLTSIAHSIRHVACPSVRTATARPPHASTLMLTCLSIR